MIARIEALMAHDTAGDPITGLKWTRRTTSKIAQALASIGIRISPNSVARLLKQMGFSLRVNHKKRSHGSSHDRNAQFEHIAALREHFAAQGLPVISVDSKKRELIGNFKNAGATWSRQATEVNDHDFPSYAEGAAIPYGVYDIQANRGTFFVGTTYDTPEFAAECIEKWWRTEGRRRYPDAKHVAVLADAGGSNGAKSRIFKYALQNRLCNRHGLTVTISHYPTGASKWNPIEHRLFSEVSKNWQGRPLDSYETVINYLRSTTTKTGLRVRAHLVRKGYNKGVKITDAQMNTLAISKDKRLPAWNYTLSPYTAPS